MTAREISGQTINVLTWFSVSSLVCIALASLISIISLTRFLEKHLLEREAAVNMELIQSIAKPDVSNDSDLWNSDRQRLLRIQDFIKHVNDMPQIIGANIFSDEKVITWSSNSDLVGRKFHDNQGLTQALQARYVIERTDIAHVEAAFEFESFVGESQVPESVSQNNSGQDEEFIESYIPVWNATKSEVIGAVEIYERPNKLITTLANAKWLVIGNSVFTGLVLYAMLLWIIRYGVKIISKQQEAVVHSEKMAAIGAMTESITHSIRNPISSIRSSAELALHDANQETAECLEDIIMEVDRFDVWIRELLAYSIDPNPQTNQANVSRAIEESIQSFGDRPKKSDINIHVTVQRVLPSAQADEKLLTQVFNSLLSNALEAIKNHGDIHIVARRAGETIEISIQDSGPGIDHETYAKLFAPMESSKEGGLGMGLPLAKRTIEGFSGTLRIDSQPGRGATVKINLPVDGTD